MLRALQHGDRLRGYQKNSADCGHPAVYVMIGHRKKDSPNHITVIEIMAHQTQNFSFMVFSFTFLILTLDIHPPTLTLI